MLRGMMILKKAEGLVWEDDPDNTPSDEAKLEALRQQRNNLLRDTDWWGCSDLTMTDAQKKYRQDLRDITETYQDLDSVVFPTRP